MKVPTSRINSRDSFEHLYLCKDPVLGTVGGREGRGRGRETGRLKEVTARTALMSHRAGRPGGRVRAPQAVPVPAPKAPSPGTARMDGQLAGKSSCRRWPPPPNVMGTVGQLLKTRGRLKRLSCEQEACRSTLHAAP